ncbi:NADH-quinone oxidoreductase subunit M [Thermotomaculum hydrothermale]|uniref:NADH-quinone oxidoreductase subunit M n=1 Tax=Thermotomaculum hydrothermale TaxID=981385 RepID=A0A7R6PP31_9BACT|nr:NADH-quinone oxidoreductase subunit M [Thermotomaculum hydrothermale]
MLGFPILTIVTFLPTIGAILIALFLNKENTKAIKYSAFFIAVVDFILSLPLWFYYDPTTWKMQFEESVSWIPSLGIRYAVGIDGISLVLVLLTTLLGFIAIWSSFEAIKHREKEYYVLLLLLQTGMLGVFIAEDFFLFYVFWEVMLVPMYFLIGVWGGPRKLYAAIKFFLYTLAGSVLMLVAILALYFYNHKVNGVWTFDIQSYHQLASYIAAHTSKTWQYLLAIAFFLGFAIKVPMFPFHTWLPDAHVEAPTAGSVILAGVLLKMGTYGFLRFLLPIFPDATKALLPYFVFLAIVGIIYGALVALIQKDMKKLVAYSSVSHLGMCMLGLFALNPNGINGSIIQMINHGISTGALFLIVGIVYERKHTRLIKEYGGLSKIMPVYATVFMIMTLSSIGLPGLNGFVGEFTILAGAFQAKPIWAIVATSGIVLGAAYMLWLYQRVMFNEVSEENLELHKKGVLKDLTPREVAYFMPLILLAFWIGLYPKPLFRALEAPVNHLVEQVEPGFFSREQVKFDLNKAKKEIEKEAEEGHHE